MLSRVSSHASTPKPAKQYPLSADAYELRDEIGQGVSAKVYMAYCKPLDEFVAVKVMDLERQDPGKLEEIRKEAMTMNILSHPNLVQSLASFVSGPNLWVVMPYSAGGSVLSIMKFHKPLGLEEPLIATIAKEVLKALDYFHRNGNIHRDVKAGNILIDGMGNVKLADFGVAASWWGSFGSNNHQTMAPEVMEQAGGYDYHADIWSLGITLLELAHGHAPFAKYPPMKVLMMTLQNPPPTLEADTGDKHFSRALRELVALCLQKDPNKRPTAAKLLEHRFIKEAKKPDYIVKHLLEGLPTLPERVRLLRDRESKKPSDQNEAQSQIEYAKCVSNWNFNLEDLKTQAALIEDSEVAAKQAADAAAQGEPKVEQKGRFKVTEDDQ